MATTIRITSAASQDVSRLVRTATLAGASAARFAESKHLVAGAGMLGQRVVRELALAGAKVVVCDFDRTAPHNLGNQFGRDGELKAETLARDCDAFAARAVESIAADIRQLSAGYLARFDTWIDCTDDPTLARPLTTLSNGLGVPLLRAAVDGSGRYELGRVLVSHGGGGHACQLCSYDTQDLLRTLPRNPCLGARQLPARPRTIAGGAIASAIAGLAVLQTQRLAGGSRPEQALDHEVVVDLSHLQIQNIALVRSPECLTNHERWRLVRLARSVDETCLGQLFAEAAKQLGDAKSSAGSAAGRDASAEPVLLEPYLHPLRVVADCECGFSQPAVASAWQPGPRCQKCDRPTRARRGFAMTHLDLAWARRQGIVERRLDELGLPPGALIIARQGRRRVHLLVE